MFIAESYEFTDECPPYIRQAWCVRDLDGRRIAFDCTEQDATAIAIAMNLHHPMRNALQKALAALRSVAL